MAGLLHVLEHLLVTALAEAEHALLGISVHPLVAVGLPEGSCLVDDVGAAIRVLAQVGREVIHVGMAIGMLVGLVLNVVVAILGKEVARGVDIAALLLDDVGKLHIALGDRVAEGVHLVAVVVDPELALDVVAGVLHDAAHRIAERGPAAVTHVHGAHGVSGHELDLGLEAAAHVGLRKVHALLTRLGEDGVLRCNGEVEVDEAGAGDLDLLHDVALGQVLHDRLGDGAGSLVGELGGFQRHGGGPLAVRGVRRSLDATIFQLECGQVAGLLGGGESGANQLFDLLGHAIPP